MMAYGSKNHTYTTSSKVFFTSNTNAFICVFVLGFLFTLPSFAQPQYGEDSLARREEVSREYYLKNLRLLASNQAEPEAGANTIEGTPDPRQEKELMKYEYLSDSMSRFPIIINANTALKIMELDPFRAKRMFFYDYNLVLDYNLYEYPSPNNKKIQIILQESLGENYRRAFLPKALVSTDPVMDRYRYKEQAQCFLRSIGAKGQVREAVDQLMQNPGMAESLFDARVQQQETLDYEKAKGLTYSPGAKPAPVGNTPPAQQKKQVAPAKTPGKPQHGNKK
jgi:hypothetical protein